MSNFMDKAKDAAEGVKDKAEELVGKATDAVPDGVKEKVGGIADKAKDLFGKAKDKVEELIPGDSDGDGK